MPTTLQNNPHTSAVRALQLSRRGLVGCAAAVAGAAFGLIDPSTAAAAKPTRRWHKPTATSTPTTSTASTTSTATATAVRPSGADYVTYESLYVPGDTLQAVFNKVPTGKIITFPAGRFEFTDFANGGDGWAGVQIPKGVRGIWGSGRGAVGSSAGTIFSIAPHSSTKARLVPTQDGRTPTQLFMFNCIGNTNTAMSFGQFHIEGTEQGHVYHALRIYNPAGTVAMTDVLVNGWRGNNGAPPGETFGIAITGALDATLTRCELDGRRTTTGLSYTAAGFYFGNAPKATLIDCYSHHSQRSTLAIWQSKNITTYDFRSNDPAGDPAGVDGLKPMGLNHERTTGCVHYRPRIMKNEPAYGVHVTHSNDSYSTTLRDGSVLNVAGGSLRLVDPVWSNTWGDNKLYVQSWSPYGNGDTMGASGNVSMAPDVVTATGSTVPYKWVHGTHYAIA